MLREQVRAHAIAIVIAIAIAMVEAIAMVIVKAIGAKVGQSRSSVERINFLLVEPSLELAKFAC